MNKLKYFNKNKEMFYSNCMIEALKRKIADPKNIKITVVF